VESIEKLKGRGNSAIYKLHLSNANKSALKIYPEISYHDRLGSEFKSTKIFKELNINNVQRPISFDSSLGIASYEWIEGERISSYGIKELKAALSFLSDLHQNSKAEQFKNFPMASDACTKGSDIEIQIKRRLLQFDELSTKYSDLEQFLKNDFKPLFKEIISWSQASWPSSSSYIVPIEKNELILSPSDFGFHNSLCSQNENLIFHDFEYFGWDDPVKLISDFSHNAAMNLTKEIEQLWFSEVSEIYGKHLLGRLSAAWPMYGLNWCLIILNEFKDEVWSRRCSSDDSKSNLRDEHLAIQLAKSKNKLNVLAVNYENKHYW
jgi:thiamine kinase-like enzyme